MITAFMFDGHLTDEQIGKIAKQTEGARFRLTRDFMPFDGCEVVSGHTIETYRQLKSVLKELVREED